MEENMTEMNTGLFPKLMPIKVYSTREGNDKCPYCGEQRTTDCIHGITTFVCGASGQGSPKQEYHKVTTPCEGKRWEGFIEVA